MPAVSKSQFRLMAAICEGKYPDGYRGISKKVACEFIHKTKSVSGLPQHVNTKNNYNKNKKYKVMYRN